MTRALALVLVAAAACGDNGAAPPDELPPDAPGAPDAPDAPDAGCIGADCALPPCRFDYVEGHGDLYVSWDDAAGLSLGLRAALEPGAGERVYDSSEVCVHIPRASFDEIAGAGGRPAGAGWDPIGVPAGRAFWFLSEVPIDGAPWFGLASDDTDAGGVPVGVFEDRLALALTVERPAGAQFSIWASVDDPEAPPFLIATAIGRAELSLITSSHAHVNWGFTHAGAYVATAIASGKLAGTGETRTSPPVIVRFVVEE